MVDIGRHQLSGAQFPSAGHNPSGRGGVLALMDLGVALLFLFALIYSFSQTYATSSVSGLYLFLFLINGLLAMSGMMIAIRRGYTSFFTTFFFSYIFFAIAPLQQVKFTWRSVLLGGDTALLAVILCLCFTIIGLGTLYLRTQFRRNLPLTKWRRGILNVKTLKKTRINFPLLLLILAPLGFGLVALYAPVLLTSRQVFGRNVGSIFPDSLAIIVSSFMHPIVFIGATTGLGIALFTKKYLYIFIFSILMIVGFAIYNPFITARFRLSAMVIFFVLVFIGRKSTRVVLFSLLVGLLLSPVLNEFRYAQEQSDARNLASFFVHLDYDAFSMICYTIDYVAQNGVDFGASALSAFLFFVPRALWTGKSEHIAAIMFPFLNSQAGVIIDNLSSPPIAEGYFAFGVPGVILASVLYFRLIYWVETRAEGSERFSPADLSACLLPMFLFILLRGPLIVGVSEITGSMAALFLVTRLLLSSSQPKARRASG